jgi:hypothetical protein
VEALCPGRVTVTGIDPLRGRPPCGRTVRAGDRMRRLDLDTRRPAVTKSRDRPRPTGRCEPVDSPRAPEPRRATRNVATTLRIRTPTAMKFVAVTATPPCARVPLSATLSRESSTEGSDTAMLSGEERGPGGHREPFEAISTNEFAAGIRAVKQDTVITAPNAVV